MAKSGGKCQKIAKSGEKWLKVGEKVGKNGEKWGKVVEGAGEW